MRRLASIALVVTALAACSEAEPPDTPAEVAVSQTPVDPAALVAERYGDCLTALQATPPVASDDGRTVVATAPGHVLVFGVGVSNTGVTGTTPADAATVASLATVDC